ncbi:MAG: Zn-ribbon domain-containing OB-fold protein [Pseudomonadota bacterium]|nr:Zn-ribbon domain-containing OB-fold protein [Pseudomonadota bacterium]
MSTSEKAIPVPNADSQAFWAAAAEGRLELQRCATCGTAQFYPRPHCAECGSGAVEPFTASGRGTVFTFTVNYRAPTPAFGADGPYVIALVDLEEGPRMMVNILDVDPAGVRIGMAVQIVFERRGEIFLPQAVPA